MFIKLKTTFSFFLWNGLVKHPDHGHFKSETYRNCTRQKRNWEILKDDFMFVLCLASVCYTKWMNGFRILNELEHCTNKFQFDNYYFKRDRSLLWLYWFEGFSPARLWLLANCIFLLLSLLFLLHLFSWYSQLILYLISARFDINSPFHQVTRLTYRLRFVSKLLSPLIHHITT